MFLFNKVLKIVLDIITAKGAFSVDFRTYFRLSGSPSELKHLKNISLLSAAYFFNQIFRDYISQFFFCGNVMIQAFVRFTFVGHIQLNILKCSRSFVLSRLYMMPTSNLEAF